MVNTYNNDNSNNDDNINNNDNDYHYYYYYYYGNCEEELPKKLVGRLLVNCRPTGYRQSTDSLPTGYRQAKKKEKLC